MKTAAPDPTMRGPARAHGPRTGGGLVRALASAKWTVAIFLLLGAGALGVIKGGYSATWMMLPPFVLLAVNLAASIATNARFRRDLPLLLFHLALLVMVGLFTVARLTYFEGSATLSAGTDFENDLLTDVRGPLHGDRIATLHFRNEGFTEKFPERSQYHATYNRLRWWDEAGNSHTADIGDDQPLVIDGYRIYTTWRRGLSPLFLWEPDHGEAEYGTVQLQEMTGGSRGYAPASDWALPGGPRVWVMLDLDELPVPRAGRRTELGADELDHHLVLRAGEQRHELRAGETVELAGGRLTYAGLGSWMGYRIVYDPTTPWLVATVIVAVASLLWFYARILFRRMPAEKPE